MNNIFKWNFVSENKIPEIFTFLLVTFEHMCILYSVVFHVIFQTSSNIVHNRCSKFLLNKDKDRNGGPGNQKTMFFLSAVIK